ncbi:MAG: hypothetical protein AAF198_08750, partial [Pseudomonadota bacterium]
MRYVVLFLLVCGLTACGRRDRQPEIERTDELTAPEEKSAIRGLFSRPDTTDRTTTAVVYGELAPEVLSLYTERTVDGVIVTASTQIGDQAAFDVSLRPLNNGFPDAEGYISYELRYDITQELNPPRRNQVLTAARFVSNA